MNLTAVIPVRAGSTRIKHKNIKPFAGTNLLINKIRQLKKITDINKIIVSSDSDEMLRMAKEEGVIPIRRPIEYCDEKSKTFNEVVRYIARNEVESEDMMWVPCVCPLIGPEKIAEGILLYKQILNGELSGDSIATARIIKEYIFNEKGPVNFDKEHHVKSQDLPDWYYITNGFFIAKTADMDRWGFVYGEKVHLCEVNKLEAIDIDDEFDFAMAEFAMRYLESK